MGPLAIKELVKAARHFAADVLFCQGGGGNASVKDSREMAVKASGFRMSDVTEGSGYVVLSTEAVNAITRDPALASLHPHAAHLDAVRRTNLLAANGPRPSMETAFHALLGRVVLHTHAVYANAFACMVCGKESLKQAGMSDVRWVDYHTPGYVLAHHLDQVLSSEERHRGTLILENHGLITHGDTAEEATRLHEEFVHRARAFFGDIQMPQLECASVEWLTGGPLIPDDAIYNGSGVIISDSVDSLQAPCVAMIDGHLHFLAQPNRARAMSESLLAHVATRELISRKGEPKAFPADEAAYLLSMESEQYRQKIASS